MERPYEDIATLLATRPASAAARLRTMACGGDVNAQLALGQLLINGVGIRLDAAEAVRWFRSAADAQLPMAINMLGRCYEYGFGVAADYVQAAALYFHASQLDCDWAMYNYAQLLAHGRGVEQDRTAALTWFRLAASRGHARAMNFVGMYCENGWGAGQDPHGAQEWYRRSAEGGDFRGQCSYASVLAEQGHIDEAVSWLRKAATTATPRFLSELVTVLQQSPHTALRAFGGELSEGPSYMSVHSRKRL